MLSTLGLGGKKKEAPKAEAEDDDSTVVSAHEKYLMKMEAIEDAKGDSIVDTEELNAALSNMTSKFIEGSRKTMTAVKDALMPEFVNRLLDARSYKYQVSQTDEYVCQYTITLFVCIHL